MQYSRSIEELASAVPSVQAVLDDEEAAAHFPHTAKRLAEREESPPPDERIREASQRREDAKRRRGKRHAKRVSANAADTEALAYKTQRRLEEAAERRERLLEARRTHLATLELQRAEKVRITKELRRKAIAKFIADAPKIFAEFEKCGLKATGVTSGDIEAVLVDDPRECTNCDDPTTKMCPVTQRPHRRKLVGLADKLLKLIGNTRVNLVPVRETQNDSVVCTTKQQRGIAVNPHLFVVAYHTAACDQWESDEVSRNTSSLLLESVEQLRHCAEDCASGTSTPQDVKLQLYCFAKAWRQYVKVMDPVATPEARAKFRQDLVQTMINVYLEVHAADRVRRRDVDSRPARDVNETLTKEVLEERRSQFADAVQTHLTDLRRRIRAVGGDEAITLLEMKIRTDEQLPPGEYSPATSPEARPVRSRGAAAPMDEMTPLPAPIHDGSVEKQLMFESESDMTSAQKDGTTPKVLPMHPTELASRSPSRSPSHAPLPPPQEGSSPEASAPSSETKASIPRRRPLVEVRGTSSTDATPVKRSVDQERPTPMGPELPADWTVDAFGISRPPTAEVVRAREQSRLEFRAKSAHKARLQSGMAATLSEVDQARAALNSAVSDALWTQFATELAATPPNVSRVSYYIGLVRENLLEALPRGLRSRVGKEIRDVLDWTHLKYEIKDYKSLVELTKYVVEKLATLGAPARTDDLKTAALALIGRMEGGEAAATVVVDVFKFLLQGVEDLRKDVASFQMMMISGDLARHATDFQREYAAAFSEPFTFTGKWLEHLINLPRVTSEAVSRARRGDQFAMKGLVVAGAVDLLSSAEKAPQVRWVPFPEETFHFDKDIVLGASNQVQLLVVRAMVVGTCGMTLSQAGCARTQAKACDDLDGILKGALQDPNMRLPQLVEKIEEHLQATCIDTTGKTMSDTLLAMVRNITNKMLDVHATQYCAFEKKLTDAMFRCVAGQAKIEDSLNVLGQRLANDVKALIVEVTNMVNHNWDTYKPFYIRLLADGAEALATAAAGVTVSEEATAGESEEASEMSDTGSESGSTTSSD